VNASYLRNDRNNHQRSNNASPPPRGPVARQGAGFLHASTIERMKDGGPSGRVPSITPFRNDRITEWLQSHTSLRIQVLVMAHCSLVANAITGRPARAPARTLEWVLSTLWQASNTTKLISGSRERGQMLPDARPSRQAQQQVGQHFGRARKFSPSAGRPPVSAVIEEPDRQPLSTAGARQ
jgi:hypothetical protein